MSIAAKFNVSWRLATNCLGVLFRNKTLLAFPIVTFFLWIVMAVLFLAPITVIHTGYNVWEAKHWKSLANGLEVTVENLPTTTKATGANNLNNVQVRVSTENLIYWLIIYIAAMFFGTFANVAFYHEILAALRGEDVSLTRGFSFALSRWHAILAWSLFAGAIGFAIRTAEERVGFFGKIITAFAGPVWSIACLFVIPVLVEADSANPIRALRYSASILKRTWGEAIIGYVGLSFGNALIAFMSVLVIGGAFTYAIVTQTYFIAVSVFATWLCVLFAYSYVMSIASHIYRGALYLYAAEGAAPRGFTTSMLNAAWKRKTA